MTRRRDVTDERDGGSLDRRWQQPAQRPQALFRRSAQQTHHLRPVQTCADLPQSWSTEDEKASSFFLLESTSIPQKNDVVALYLVTQARK
jgi:hypothetical protein